MRPRVVFHVAAGVDGRIDSFSPDMGLFCGLAAADGVIDPRLLSAEPPEGGVVWQRYEVEHRAG